MKRKYTQEEMLDNSIGAGSCVIHIQLVDKNGTSTIEISENEHKVDVDVALPMSGKRKDLAD